MPHFLSTTFLENARRGFGAVALFLAMLAAGSIFFTPGLAASSQGSDPFRMAAKHAQMAAEAKELALIHSHLQHVLNCLEGKGG